MCNDRMKTLAGMLQIMNGFRPGIIEDKYVIVCTKPNKEWKVGQLTTEPIAPIHYVDGHTFNSVEAAQRAVEELTATSPGGREAVATTRPAPGLVDLGHQAGRSCR